RRRGRVRREGGGQRRGGHDRGGGRVGGPGGARRTGSADRRDIPARRGPGGVRTGRAGPRARQGGAAAVADLPLCGVSGRASSRRELNVSTPWFSPSARPRNI